MGYDKKQTVHVRSANASDNQDLLHIFIPAKTEIDIYGLRAMIDTTGAAGSQVELVNVSDAILAVVSMSGAANAINEVSFSNGPITFTNSNSTPTFLKLRQNVAGGASSDVQISLDLDHPGSKPRIV